MEKTRRARWQRGSSRTAKIRLAERGFQAERVERTVQSPAFVRASVSRPGRKFAFRRIEELGAPYADSDKIRPDFIVDRDTDGFVRGLEFLGVSRLFSEEAIQGVRERASGESRRLT